MSDHVRLEQLGVPTVTLVVDAFEAAARAHARIHGDLALPFVIVGRDLLSEPDDAIVRERDTAVFDAIEAAITR
ncbi:MAG: hypothetical protein KDB21_05680 [Acidimicrobiales bacterium]|nr:hypothetical protein [Acidimicrobiales bacterium]